MTFDLLERRKQKFTLWVPGQSADAKPPQLLLGTFSEGPPPAVNTLFQGPLKNADQPDLWELDPNEITPSLTDGAVYHYWFVIEDTSMNLGVIPVTDPLAYTVDYRTAPNRQDNYQPPGVIKFRNKKLWPCDRDGNEPSQVTVPAQDSIPDNNHIVIYELPVSWARYQKDGTVQKDVGTFSDVLALFDLATAGDRFSAISQIANEAIVSDLGINALELLPAADAKTLGEWGYATANYFAPDFDLGKSSELVKLVEKIHSMNIRLFTDVVMAFGHDPYAYIAFKQFHIDADSEPSNADSQQSHGEGPRNGYGGRLWRYIQNTNTYDPQSGSPSSDVHPSWVFHKAHLNRWMSDFGVGGLRLDSINNIANYGFIKSYKDEAWSLYRSRSNASSDAKFLVIGEELSVPTDLITSGTLNALWNEPFQGRLRAAIIGESANINEDFEWTVRKMIDCTLDSSHPFTDCTQAINYITSHDTEGPRKERLYNYLDNNHVTDIERRAKLAFVNLFTAVGVPMILAGEEFVDQMDGPGKQTDPVNYERKSQDWRTRIFNYVAALIRLRKACPALGQNDTEFIHVDNSRGGKIIAWKRGGPNQAPVVVVANFTDEDTPGTEYFVENWPDRDRSDWREISQNRDVPSAWVGREPLAHWEAKVYTYWRESPAST